MNGTRAVVIRCTGARAVARLTPAVRARSVHGAWCAWCCTCCMAWPSSRCATRSMRRAAGHIGRWSPRLLRAAGHRAACRKAQLAARRRRWSWPTTSRGSTSRRCMRCARRRASSPRPTSGTGRCSGCLVGAPARCSSSANASATRCAWCTRWPRRCSAGDMVAVFPEGTTGDGRALLPFHANLLQAAIATGTPVQPVALRFFDARHRLSPAAEFLGETTLVHSVWRIACARGVRCDVTALPARPARMPTGARWRRRCAQDIDSASLERSRSACALPLSGLALVRHGRGRLGRRLGVAEVVAADRLQDRRRARTPAGCRWGC